MTAPTDEFIAGYLRAITDTVLDAGDEIITFDQLRLRVAELLVEFANEVRADALREHATD